MNAQNLIELSNTITNVEKLDKLYDKVLVPMLKIVAERKGRELCISDYGTHLRGVDVRKEMKQLGFKGDLQYLCRQEMMPYLIEKGFNISYSPYFTNIRW